MFANRMLLFDDPLHSERCGYEKQTAGLLMYCHQNWELKLLLMHPGGPYFRNQDLGTWTIPKGQIRPGESPFNAACLRFTVEIGMSAFAPFIPLEPAYERSGNIVHGWAFEGDCGREAIECKTPAVDRAGWFTLKA